MSALIPFLVFCQALGAFGGAFTAVWGEVLYMRAMQDGKIDTAEAKHLVALGGGLRFGMALLLIASCALVICAYMEHSTPQPALTESYWTFILLVLLIITVSWRLSRKKILFSLGSAALLTAWWFLVYLTIGEFPILSIGASIAFYVIATGILFVVLHYARFWVTVTSTS